MQGFVAIALAAGLLAPSAAMAADPPAGPMTIQSEGFESGYPANLTIAPRPIPEPSSAKWGRVSSLARTGTWGMWCAGQGGAWPTYPNGSHSDAAFALPELGDYYSSRASLYYNMPSWGSADGVSFWVVWYRSANNSVADWDYGFPLTGSGEWRSLSYDLSNASGRAALSRTSGVLSLTWTDQTEAPGETPTNGQGATIDDILITGYKYGPPRVLTCGQAGSGIQLNWSVPWRDTLASGVETRSIEYRVWRADGSGPSYAWTELTSSRTAGTSWLDTSPSMDTTYTYLVQAWDTGAGTGYGEPATATARASLPLQFTKTASASTVASGTSVTYTYVARNVGGGSLVGVTITDDKLGSILSSTTLSPSQAATVTRSAALTASTTNIATATAISGGQPLTQVATATVAVIHPAVGLSRSVDTSVQVVGGSVTHTFTVTNTGDVGLAGVAVKDSVIGTVASGLSLAPGASTSVAVARALPATTTFDATATAVDAVIGSSVNSGKKSVTVWARNPQVLLTQTPSKTNVAVGETVTVTYSVTNTGDTSLASVLVTDQAGGAYPWVGTLLPGQTAFPNSRTVTITADVTLSSRATAAYGTAGTPFYGTVTDTRSTFINAIAPAMSLSKTASASAITSGTSVTYTYRVTNTGDATLTGAVVSDNKLGSILASTTLFPSQGTTITRSVALTATTTNIASATASAQGSLLTDVASATVTVVHPTIALGRSVDTTVQAIGRSVTHTFTISNPGDVALTGVAVRDSVMGTVTSGLSLSAGGSTSVAVQRALAATTTFDATATAVDALAGSAVNSGKKSLTVWARNPQISLWQDVSPKTVSLGETVTVWSIVTNTGDTALDSVVVTDQAGSVHPMPSLLPGAQQSLFYDVTMTASTDFSLCASGSYGFSGAPFSGVVSRNGFVTHVDVLTPGISVAKSADRTSINPGESVSYTFTVANSGQVDISGITLSDGALGTIVSGFALASGESTTTTRTVTPASSQSAAASAIGTYSPRGFTVTGTSGVVSVSVYVPPPPPPPYVPPPAPTLPALPGHAFSPSYPLAPSTVYYGRTFTIYGYLKPRHTAGAYSVKLEGYRYEKQSNGTYKWVRRATWYAKNYNYSTYTKYIKATNIKLRGKWRIRGVHTHTGYLPKYSSYRYLTVR